MGMIVSAPPLGVKNIALVSNQYLTSIVNAVATQAQPAASNLSNGTTGSGAVVLAASPAFTGGASYESATLQRWTHRKTLTDNTLTDLLSITIPAGRVCGVELRWHASPGSGVGSGVGRSGVTYFDWLYRSDSGAITVSAVTDLYQNVVTFGGRTLSVVWSTDGGTIATGVLLVRCTVDDSGNGASALVLQALIRSSNTGLVVAQL